MVQCKDCGLVGWHGEAGGLNEVSTEVRRGPIILPISLNLVCAKKACDFVIRAREVIKSGQQDKDGRAMHETLFEEIECKHFREWSPGFTPKEHIQMMHHEYMQEMARKQREDDRNWQENVRRDDRRHRMIINILSFFGGIIVTIALGYFFGIRRDGGPIQ